MERPVTPATRPAAPPHRRLAPALCALGVVAAACSTGPVSSVASGRAARESAAPGAVSASGDSGAAVAARPVAPLKARLRPDVLVVSRRPMAGSTVQALRRLSP